MHTSKRQSSGKSDVISYGITQIHCKTDEDRYFQELSSIDSHNPRPLNVSSFGVFDGHGGEYASSLCADKLHESILTKYLTYIERDRSTKQFSEKYFCRAIYRCVEDFHGDICEVSDSGTTAASIFIISLNDGSVRIICTWVGDSRCCAFQIDPKTGNQRSMIMSEDHKPSLPREVYRIKKRKSLTESNHPVEIDSDMFRGKSYPSTYLSEADIAVHLMTDEAETSKTKATEPTITNETEPSISITSEMRNSFPTLSSNASNASLNDAVNDHLHEEQKSLSSGVTDTENEQDLDASQNSCTSRGYSSDCITDRINLGDKPRPLSFIARRHVKKAVATELGTWSAGDTGPLAVFSPNGVSLTMTRSIGDRDGPHSCIAQPDITSLTVPASEHARLVLASDGMWDVLSVAMVQRVALSEQNPLSASERLATMAQRKRVHMNIKMDDITVVVVDVNYKLFHNPYNMPLGCRCSLS